MERYRRNNQPKGTARCLNRRRRRAVVGLAALCCGCCILAWTASLATASRKVESAFGSFSGADSLGFEPNGDVWISDSGQGGNPPGQEGIYEYSAYPSKTLLTAPNTYTPWQYYILDLQLAVDEANEEVFVTQANGREVDIFSPNQPPAHRCGKNTSHEQELFCFLRAWTAINGATGGSASEAGIHVAIDNSNTLSRGRVYLSLTAPEDYVEALDAEERPVQFPATASYIAGNRLTGTPSGPFTEVQNVAVDSNGNIYVTDAGKGVIDEFDSTGTFLRTFPGSAGVGVDPTNGNVLVAAGGVTEEYDSLGNFLGTISVAPSAAPAVTPEGHAYIPAGGQVDILSPAAVVPKITYEGVSNATVTSGTLDATVDPNGGTNVNECTFEYGTSEKYGSSILCSPASPYSSASHVTAELSGLTTGTTYHYRVVAKNASGIKYGEDQTYTPQRVVGLSTHEATDITSSGAKLTGSFFGNGEETQYYFEWGPTSAYGEKTGLSDTGNVAAGVAKQFSAEIEHLGVYSTYHYRVVASNGAGTSYGEDKRFTTRPGIPTGRESAVTEVHADRVDFHAEVNPNGADTKVDFEYVDEAEYQSSGWEDASKTTPEVDVGMGKGFQSVSSLVSGVGLAGSTVYHFRVVGTNEAGSGNGAEGTFKTFSFTPSFNDQCPNAHVRQQTGAAHLLDCRAYELVSAANTGGYDVESSLVAGGVPFGGYPEAASLSTGEPQVLYGVHDGGIPGTGFPTNHGVDPYVATRTPNGWVTRYVGIPANDPYAQKPFSSTVLEASPSLETLAFGGPEICSPCFADGSSGNPIHLPDEELVQGMSGSLSKPAATPAGYVNMHLSADGSHFIFGTASQLEPDAEEGKVSIYDRDLLTRETHVVSKLAGGTNIPCITHCESDGIGELGVSSDGSHIVVGQLLTQEGEARYWHLYMRIGDETTVDLTPGTTTGALFDGMTADGSKVFFSSTDHLTGEDTSHTGADIYEAEVSPQGQVTLRLISTGSEGAGNNGACDPASNTVHEYWNTTSSEANCGDVAIGGGGGVASESGTIYFLSPRSSTGLNTGSRTHPTFTSLNQVSSQSSL